MSSSKRRRLRFPLLVVIPVLLGFVFWALFFSNKNKVVVAPYYPKSAFQLPADLPEKNATTSAQSVRLPVIMYHYVENVRDKRDLVRIKLNVTPALFESQLQKLENNHYHSYFARDIPAIVHHQIDLPEKPIVLTFDDGYEDFYTTAYPLLKKYQMKATVYVMANFLGKRGYLSAGQLQTLSQSGLVEIGSHTLDHPDLKALKIDQARKEIVENKIKLEELFHIPIVSFAYPYGSFNKDIAELVRKAGYTSAVSVVPGLNQSEDNLFYLFRLRPGIFETNANYF